jgi:F-type H+-transporting ATPase subunit epsilon
MADKLHFSLVSPAKELFSGEVDHVIAPGTEGEFGVLVNHAPFMTTLKNGVVRVLENDATKMRLFVRGGFADVTPAGLTILAEEAVDLSSVDAATVDAELTEAKNNLAAEGKDGPHKPTLQAQIDYLADLKAALVH